MTGREAGIACVLATVVGGGALAQITPSAPRADQMHEQFRAVTGAQDAIVRGDLEDARHQARTVAAFPDPADLPPGAAPHLAAMRAAAGQAAEAADLRVAAAATAAMLANCGSCHRAVGTMPAHRAPPEARVGGVIGHMITHQAAMDLLLQGLVTPSTSLWNQ